MIQKVCLCLVMQWGESSIKVTKHRGPHLSTLSIEGSRFFLTIEISNVPQNKKISIYQTCVSWSCAQQSVVSIDKSHVF